jgi:hypothetical protein
VICDVTDVTGCGEESIMRKIGTLSGRSKDFWSLHSTADELLAGIVIQILTEPSLDFHHAHSFANVIVRYLVAINLAKNEIPRLGMGEVESTYAGTGPHGERLGDEHSGIFLYIEQLPERAFFRVVWASWITRGRTDTAILFMD